MMSDKLKKILTACCIIILFIAAAASYMYFNRTRYNPDGVHGNTAGNLNNNGLFCEYDGRIYFANPYDKNRLYVMDTDCSNIRKLNDDTVCSLNVYGSYIYYVRNNFSPETATMIFRGQLLGVIRTGLNGQKPLSLYDSVAGVINLYGNDLYYQHYSDKDGFSFYKMGIDGRNNTRISDAGYYPASIYGDSIYYANTEDNHNISFYNTKTGAGGIYIQANAYMVDMQGDYIYYIDLDADYSLVRVNTSTLDRELLVDGSNGKCISYNLYDNVIFYHVEGETPALYRMNTDGTGSEFIKSGNITNISCTSQYTFFQLYGVTSLYRVPTTGGTGVELISIESD